MYESKADTKRREQLADTMARAASVHQLTTSSPSTGHLTNTDESASSLTSQLHAVDESELLLCNKLKTAKPKRPTSRRSVKHCCYKHDNYCQHDNIDSSAQDAAMYR